MGAQYCSIRVIDTMRGNEMNNYMWEDGFGRTHIEVPDEKGKRKVAKSLFGTLSGRNGSAIEFDKAPSARSGYAHYVER